MAVAAVEIPLGGVDIQLRVEVVAYSTWEWEPRQMYAPSLSESGHPPCPNCKTKMRLTAILPGYFSDAPKRRWFACDACGSDLMQPDKAGKLIARFEPAIPKRPHSVRRGVRLPSRSEQCRSKAKSVNGWPDVP